MNDSIRVYAAPTLVEAETIRQALGLEGIAAEVRNGGLVGVTGGIPVIEAWPEVWVPAEDAARATELLARLRDDGTDTGRTVECTVCGAELPSAFAVCWRCGARQAGVEGPGTAGAPTGPVRFYARRWRYVLWAGLALLMLGTLGRIIAAVRG